MKHLSRRSVTTGAIAAVAVIPAVGLSVGPSRAAIPIPAASDAELLGLWGAYRKQLRAVRRAEGPKEAAYAAVWDGLGPRLKVQTVQLDRSTLDRRWVAIVRDYSSRQEEDIKTPLPGAVSCSDAEAQAAELDRGWNEEWERRWKELSELHERDRHMDAWCAECKKLSEISKTIGRTPANGIDGIAVKFRLITELLRDEDQEDSGPVIKSLAADLKRLGAAV